MLKTLITTLLVALLSLGTVPRAAVADDGGPVMLTPQELEVFVKANELFQNARYQDIVSLLHDAVENTDRPHPYGCILYGLAYLRLNNPAKACAVFRKGLTASPRYVALHLNLGVALVEDGKHQAAGDSFMQAAALEKTEAAINYAYSAAQCYYFAQNYARSLEALGRVLRSGHPKTDWLQLAAANCMHLSRWKEAEGHLGRLVEREPGKRQHWKGLAYARQRQGKDAASAAALDIAARLPGATAEDRRQLAGMYRRANAPLLALETEKLLPPGRGRDRAAIGSLMRANRNARLVGYIDGLLEKEPSAELYLIKGVAHYRLRDLHRAREAFRLGGDIPGKEAERCRLLEGMVAWEERDWHGAKQAFAALLEGDEVYARQAGQAIEAIEAMEEIEREILGIAVGGPPEIDTGTADERGSGDEVSG